MLIAFLKIKNLFFIKAYKALLRFSFIKSPYLLYLTTLISIYLLLSYFAINLKLLLFYYLKF